MNDKGFGEVRLWARRLGILVAGGAVLLSLAGCGDGGSEGSARLVQASTSSTTTSTTSSSVPEATTTTVRPRSGTTATTRATTPPPPAAGEPRVIASPSRAAPETRVSISGEGFTAEHWKAASGPLWLAGGPSGCDFYADADHSVTVSADGRLSGSFVVPSHGNCRQSTRNYEPVLAGRYRIVYQCTACTIGDFEVTVSAPPAVAECDDVVFAPNSENIAGDIVAYGLPCEEAEVVLRNVAGPFGPISGAERGEYDGFTCVRTSQSEGRGLPSATYECTRGSQRITFTRT